MFSFLFYGLKSEDEYVLIQNKYLKLSTKNIFLTFSELQIFFQENKYLKLFSIQQ